MPWPNGIYPCRSDLILNLTEFHLVPLCRDCSSALEPPHCFSQTSKEGHRQLERADDAPSRSKRQCLNSRATPAIRTCPCRTHTCAYLLYEPRLDCTVLYQDGLPVVPRDNSMPTRGRDRLFQARVPYMHHRFGNFHFERRKLGYRTRSRQRP